MTVTFQPDLEILRRQLAQLPVEALKIVVDNASAPEAVAELRLLVSALPQAHLIENARNLGLAGGLNVGIQRASAEQGRTHVLLLDQDTEVSVTSVLALFTAYLELAASGARLGCIGPRLVDAETGLQHGFHAMAHGFWIRQYPPSDSIEPVSCDNINGSGTLARLDLFCELGGLDESLFIDHVDTEWGFRVKAAGYRLLGVPWVSFRHRMGTRTLRFWFGRWRTWPYRAPHRHYFLFRNTVRLMRRTYVPPVWKVWAAAKLMLTLLAHLVADPRRSAQLREMARGLKSGFSRRTQRDEVT